MKKAPFWLLIGVLAVALAGVAALPSWRDLVGGADIPVAEVQRGDFIRRVEAEGNLKAAKATLLTPPIDIEWAVKIAWLAPDGSRVKQGDVVVRFDPTDMEKNLYDGRTERETADSQILQKKVQEDTTLRNLDRDAEFAGRELKYATEFQSKDAEIFSRTEIIESEIDERLATHRKQHAEETRGVREDLAQVELDLLGIERRKAELKIQRAEQGLEALELVAPHDGIFVLKRHWSGIMQVGTVVWRGTPVAEIPQLDEMEAEVFVLEADAGGLAEGLPAEVTLEAHPDRVYKATVRTVDALPKRRVRKVPVQYFAATLELERTEPQMMKPGQRVRATLVLDEQKGVLTVPREAVFEKDGKKVAYREQGDGFEPVEVSPGPAALGRVVIEQGLEEGDRIALRDPTRAVEDEQPEEGEPAVAPPTAAGS